MNEPLQQTQEWFASRVGYCTASRAGDVLAQIKSGEAAVRRNYKAQLVAERLTGRPAETFTSAAMQFGIDNEPFSRLAYEAATGNIVQEVSFIRHPELMAGASPDGTIGEFGLFEAKCPNTANHIDTLLKGMPPEHIPQLQFQLWITERKWVDFVSFDPRLPEKLQLYVQRIERDNAYIDKLVSAVTLFLSEVDELVLQLEKKAA